MDKWVGLTLEPVADGYIVDGLEDCIRRLPGYSQRLLADV